VTGCFVCLAGACTPGATDRPPFTSRRRHLLAEKRVDPIHENRLPRRESNGSERVSESGQLVGICGFSAVLPRSRGRIGRSSRRLRPADQI
jgi:hypothetical protein